MRKLLPPLLTLVLLTPILQAQPAPLRHRALIPIYLEQPIPGAFGSQWTSEFAIHNSSNRDFLIEWCSPADDSACILNLFADEELVPGETQTRLPNRYPKPQGGVPGAVVYLLELGTEPVDFRAVAFQLRVADTTRRALSAGTEIPVVRERDFRTSATNLLSVPVESRFRLILRLYEMNLQTASFAVNVYDQATGNLLQSRGVTIASAKPQGFLRFVPTYGEITDLAQIALQSPSAPSRLRISIEPRTPGSAFWGFVSVTNNETQEFTVVTPQ